VVTCNHARSPLVNSVLIGVKATSGGRMREREPTCRAGRKSPILCRVWTRDGSAWLYVMLVWWDGPVSAVGAAREDMDSAGDWHGSHKKCLSHML